MTQPTKLSELEQMTATLLIEHILAAGGEKQPTEGDEWAHYKLDGQDLYVPLTALYAWFEGNEEGAVIGEASETLPQLRKLLKESKEARNQANIEFFSVEIAARELCEATKGSSTEILERTTQGSLVASTEAARKLLLLTCKNALKSARDAKAWPDWALAATAAGWKPPRGWKP